MKKVLGVVLGLFIGAFASAQPSIAVLDALIEAGVDISAQGPVTEKIIEAFVASGDYTVLDRSNVQDVLEEKKFQLSGLVRDSEIKQAGEYLGADFVCVAKVSKVGQTYFVSGKIIDVETGAISAQTSQERKGEIDIVLELARIIGLALVGGEIEPLPDEVESRVDKTTPEDTIDPTEPARSTSPVAHITAAYVYPLFIGNGARIIGDAVVETVESLGGTSIDHSVKRAGIDLHVMQPFLNIFYASASASVMTRADQSDYFNPSDEYLLNFRIFEASLAGGAIFRLFPLVQVYGGVGLGMIGITLIDEYWVNLISQNAMDFHIEAGADLILGDFVVLNVLAIIGITSLPYSATGIFTDEQVMGFFSINIGGGISYSAFFN